MSASKLTLLLAALFSGIGLFCWALASSSKTWDPTVIAGSLAFLGLVVLGMCVESAGNRVAVALVMLASKVGP